MHNVQSKRKQAGFTLVELLIVAIILAILAAIIIPQFASTTIDAQESALRTNVSAMRSALDVYRQQHGAYPGATAATGGTCTGGTAGRGPLGSGQPGVSMAPYSMTCKPALRNVLLTFVM